MERIVSGSVLSKEFGSGYACPTPVCTSPTLIRLKAMDTYRESTCGERIARV